MDTDPEYKDQVEPWTLTLNLFPHPDCSIELELKTPTEPLGTHLEFNPSHFIVEFIWIFFKSLLPESSEVVLLFPVVTKEWVKQGS